MLQSSSAFVYLTGIIETLCQYEFYKVHGQKKITDGKIKTMLTIQTSVKYTGRAVLSNTKGICNDYLCQESFNLVTGFRGEKCLFLSKTRALATVAQMGWDATMNSELINVSRLDKCKRG